MNILKSNEQAVEIVLTPQDVEEAVKQFIWTRHSEYYSNWTLTPKYNLGAIVIAGTKK